MEQSKDNLMLPVDALNLNKVLATKDTQVITDLPATAAFSPDVTLTSLLTSSIDEHEKLSSATLKRQGFRVDNYNLMVKFEDGNQISDVPNIFSLPNSPEWFLGMSNLNGQTIPVFNLKKYFDIPETHELGTYRKQMLFVIQHAENATGIVIDGLLERVEVDIDAVQADMSIPKILDGCVNDAYLLNDEIWYDLNCLSFLDRMEAKIAH